MKPIIIFLFVAVVLFTQGGVWAQVYENYNLKEGIKIDGKELVQSSTQEVKIDKNLVCMMNDKYMDGKEQIPIEVEGKTYYGCCQGCVTALNYKRSTRYSIDPLSGKEVDKADAYIVMKTDGSKRVLYFESIENYLKFINQSN